MLSRWYLTDYSGRSLLADCQRSNPSKALKSSKSSFMLVFSVRTSRKRLSMLAWLAVQNIMNCYTCDVVPSKKVINTNSGYDRKRCTDKMKKTVYIIFDVA